MPWKVSARLVSGTLMCITGACAATFSVFSDDYRMWSTKEGEVMSPFNTCIIINNDTNRISNLTLTGECATVMIGGFALMVGHCAAVSSFILVCLAMLRSGYVCCFPWISWGTAFGSCILMFLAAVVWILFVHFLDGIRFDDRQFGFGLGIFVMSAVFIGLGGQLLREDENVQLFRYDQPWYTLWKEFTD